jgi:hypothetical protein
MHSKGKIILVQAVEALRVARGWGSHIFWHSAHRLWQCCQPYAPAAFYTTGRFLVLISVGGWVDPRAIVRLEGLGQLKKSISFGTGTGDLPACRIVPEPTTLPRATWMRSIELSIIWTVHWEYSLNYYYGSTALCWALAAFWVSWSYTHSVGLLGRGIRPL